MDVLRDGTDVPNLDTPPPVTLAQATLYWLKLGFMSFGGPAGQIAIMHHDLVEKKRWISENRFLHALNYCMVLPGPEAQQLATYIGWLMHRTAGGLIARRLSGFPLIEGWTRIQIAIIPKSEMNKVAPGLIGIAARLEKEDSRLEMPRSNILVRTKTIPKLAHGGARSISVHLASVLATMPNSRRSSAVLLLDDVATSGNSLIACTQLLYQAGASLVVPVLLGRSTH